MQETLFDIDVQPREPLCRQITRQIRERIQRGDLVPGSRLPSTEELTRFWKTNQFTAHTALKSLVAEGLLERWRGVGTFVRKQASGLTCVGVYFPGNIWTQRISAFQQSINAALRQRLGQSRVQTEVWVDPRSSSKQDRPWDDLVRAAKNREFQALITTMTDRTHICWLQKIPVPFAFLGCANLPGAVNLNMPQLAELSLRQLAHQGCRSVGLITLACPNVADRAASRYLHAFFDRFVTVAGKLKLTINNRWMGVPHHPDEARNETEEHFGYRKFRELWRQTERPDGLVVATDNTAKGVLVALLEERVRVPQELKLVLHKNAGVELLCPVPATFVVSDEKDVAQALIGQAQKQARGETCKPVLVPFTLASAGKTNSQPAKDARASTSSHIKPL